MTTTATRRQSREERHDDRQLVTLRGLVKSWPSRSGPVRAVRGVDLSIARGQVLALLGPNGAGKSTTIDMLLGLVRPDAGTWRSSVGRPATRFDEAMSERCSSLASRSGTSLSAS